MNILLTTAPLKLSEILPKENQPFQKILKFIGGGKPILGVQPQYGLLYLSSYLKKVGHHVTIEDGFFSSEKEILKIIREKKIDFIGLSVVTMNWENSKRFSKLLKKSFPLLKIAVGGPHINAVMGESLEESTDIDFSLYGDCEELLVRLISNLERREGLFPEDGLAFRHGSILLKSEKNAYIRDLNSMLLMDREAVDLHLYRPSPLNYRYLPFTAIFGSRGCPYKCTFCHTDSLTRMRSAENIVEEIEFIQLHYKIREIIFYDDTFTLDKKRILKLCALIKKKKIRVSWGANIKAGGVTPELLSAMKEAGCWRVLMGIETGNRETLLKIRKDISLDDIRQTVKMAKKAGIQVQGQFIFGYPNEGMSESQNTIEFMKELELDFVDVNALTPFPGTSIYEEIKGDGGVKPFSEMNMFDISYVPPKLTENQLSFILKDAFNQFYLRPKYVLKQLKNIKSLTDFIRYARALMIVLLRKS